MLQINIPRPVRQLLDALENAGFEALIVGGCVRDAIRGEQPHDWDICTNAKPEQTVAVVSSIADQIVDVGLHFGTVAAILHGEQYEITTYRTESDYTDGRRPNKVEFVGSLKDDLARRDFTINAMAYSPIYGLVDPFGGRDDIDRGIIRCVGDPYKRFSEDGLRILRAIRFASRFGYSIDETTKKAMSTYKNLLWCVSSERVRDEITKTLVGKNVTDVLIEYADIIASRLRTLAPCVGFDQNNKFHSYTVYDHIAHAVGNYHGNDIITKVALLLHDIGKPSCYSEDENGGHFHDHQIKSASLAAIEVNILRYPNDVQNKVVELVRYHDEKIDPTPKAVRRWMAKIGNEQFARLLDMQRADIEAHKVETQIDRIEKNEKLRAIFKEEIENAKCLTLRSLAFNGHDVMQLGIQEGKDVGWVLQYLFAKVVDGEVENEHEALKGEAMRFVKENAACLQARADARAEDDLCL